MRVERRKREDMAEEKGKEKRGGHLREAVKFSDEKGVFKPPRIQLNFALLPRFLREGPWSPWTYVVMAAWIAALVFTVSDVQKHFVADDGFEERGGGGNGTARDDGATLMLILRYGGVVWTLTILVWMVLAIGWWPFISYTVQGWSLLTLRYLCSVFGFRALASIIRVPCLIMAGITVFVWWAILFPAFMTMMNAKARKGFLRFNTSPLLINLHLFNLPLALLDVYLSPRSLNDFDVRISLIGVPHSAHLITYYAYTGH